ncbi:MAG: phenylalanine--tRNA ligase subunit beta, partial [Microbacteriaceae bacterium]|nr:phenylalanine--tRNA ligase subunit beta [Microbacteriaceae bacterium]
EQRLRRSVAQMLAGNGLTEVLAYPFVSGDSNDIFGSAVAGVVPAMRLVNPLDGEAPFLRTSLIPGLIGIAHRNLSRGLVDLGIYELGTVFRPAAERGYGSGPLPSGVVRPSDGELSELLDSIPPQPLHLGALFVGAALPKQPGQAAVQRGIVDAIDAARQAAAAVNATLSVRAGSHQALHPGRTAELMVGDTGIGYAGELLPALAEEYDLPRVTAVLELDLGLLIDLAAREVSPTAIATFPAATQDLSLVVPITTPAGDVLAAVVDGAGELLEDARLVDDYRGPGVPDGSRSLTFALRFRAADRTLTAVEASDAKLAGAALAAERLGATVRE